MEDGDGNDLMAFFELMGMDLNTFYIEIQDDGTCIMSMDNDAKEGTYKVDGTNIILSVEGEEVPAIIEEDKITIEQGGDPELGSAGVKMVFQKQ